MRAICSSKIFKRTLALNSGSNMRPQGRCLKRAAYEMSIVTAGTRSLAPRCFANSMKEKAKWLKCRAVWKTPEIKRLKQNAAQNTVCKGPRRDNDKQILRL